MQWSTRGPAPDFKLPDDNEEVQRLNHVTAWLIINSMRMQRLQFNMLQCQNAENLWRKAAFNFLLRQSEGGFKLSVESEDVQRCVRVFDQELDLSINPEVPIRSINIINISKLTKQTEQTTKETNIERITKRT